MRFGVRNAYYLRISAGTVLPLYLYLDERHIEWMSERILQHVLEDLRPRILTKLKDEADAHLGPGGPANAKRGAVDVHRGDTYQFGYFLRKTDPHSVLIKTRRFVAAPRPLPRPKSPSPEPPTQKRRKRAPKKSAPTPKAAKKRKTKGKQKAQESDEDEGVISISSDDGDDDVDADVVIPSASAPPRRSSRKRKIVTGGYVEHDEDEQPPEVVGDTDVEMAGPGEHHEDVPGQIAGAMDTPLGFPALDDSGLITLEESEGVPPAEIKREDAEPPLSDSYAANVVQDEDEAMDIAASSRALAAELDLQVEETEAKPKPVLQLIYQGFNIHGRCLCVIVEPWPPIRGASRAPSLAPTGLIAPRAPSIAPPDFVPSGAAQRARTPLFLPEYDRERSVTPAPFMSRAQRSLPPVPLFHEDALGDDSDSEDDGLMQFSQMLRSVGEHQAGAVGDDDEIDGAVFFGDADETREL
ncbi:hypothetical protein B0H21DRAFT_818089 [Amylocystis lapponica]|nr:hypothetical protein B0H21DRAFT_818089 [Amylocystis lapponica]